MVFISNDNFLWNIDEFLFPSRISKTGHACSNDDLEQIKELKSDRWHEIVSRSKLNPGYEDTRKNYFKVTSSEAYTHLRLNYYPDGGVARFKVYGVIKNDFLKNPDEKIDLAGMLSGGVCLSFSNAHYGHPNNLLKPNKGINMGDGWETARRLDRPEIVEVDQNGILCNVPGKEWAIIKLGIPGLAETVIVDTLHFNGNFPDTIEILGIFMTNENADVEAVKEEYWQEVVPETKVINEINLAKTQIIFFYSLNSFLRIKSMCLIFT